MVPRLSTVDSTVLFWSAISVFPRGAFNLRTVTFKDTGFSGLCNDFHCLNVDVWVALSKEINSIFLNWKWTEKLRGFIDFLCLVLGALVKQSMGVNFSASRNRRSHFQGNKLRKMWIDVYKKWFWRLDLARARSYSALTTSGYILLEMNYKQIPHLSLRWQSFADMCFLETNKFWMSVGEKKKNQSNYFVFPSSLFV